jgi:RecA/RadA recombinase
MTTINEIMKSKKNYAFYKKEDYGKDFPRLYTGIFALDYCTGGIPVGVTTTFWGPPSAGKSTAATKLLGISQNTCWNCFEFLWDCKCKNQIKKKSVIVTNEGFDIERAAQLGCDISDLIVAEPATGEECVDIIYECLNAEDCGTLLLDSFSRVIPEAEIYDPALTNHMGKRAQLHTKLMNKVKSTLIQNKRKKINSCFIAINQARASLKGGYGPTEEMQGCYASKHDWHLSVRLGALAPKSDTIDKDTELPIYSRHSLSLVSPGVKRKVFTLAGKGEFLLALEDTPEYKIGDSCDHKTTLDYAVKLGLLKKQGWKLFDTDYGKKEDMLNRWQEDPEHYLTIKRRIIEHAADVKRGLIEKTEEAGTEEG